MKYIRSFNESSSNIDDDIKDLLNKFSKSIDVNRLRSLLEPYKNILKKKFDRYSINGVLSVELIRNDIGLNEGLIDIIDKITDVFSKILEIPINIILSIVNMFSKLFTRNGYQALVIAGVLFIMGISFYEIGEHAINGISIGVVKNVEFVPEHIETVAKSYTDSDGEDQIYYEDVLVPDTWNIKVKASNGRIEEWTTTDQNNKEVDENDVVRITDWNWVGTSNRGEKLGGGFSGGGTGGSF